MGDTWISPDYPRTHFGSQAAVHLQGSWTPVRLLLLPSLNGLPPGATVQRASLELFVYDAATSGDTAAACRLLRAWNPATANYRSPWKRGPRAGLDYAATPVATFAAGGAG